MTQTNGTTLGLCPACGKGDLVESAKAWGCSRWKPEDGHGFQNKRTLKIFSVRLRIDDPDTGHVALVFEPRQKPRKQA